MIVNSICGHGDFYDLFSPGLTGPSRKLVLCKVCGLAFLYPVPTPEEIKDNYPEDYYSFSELEEPPGRFDPRRMAIRGSFGSSRLTDLVSYRLFRQRFGGGKRVVEAGRILDVGCGDGYFLSAVKELGWEACGVELNEQAARRGREKGIEVFAGDLREASFKSESFDVVRMAHVLEHTANPLLEIDEAHRVLRPQGRFIVSVPNLSSLSARLFKSNWCGLDLPRHIYHFSPTNLMTLLEKAGFRNAKVFYYSVGTGLSSLEAVYRRRKNSSANGRIFLNHPVIKFLGISYDLIANLLGRGDCIEVHTFK